MPTFNFRCKKCDNTWDEFVREKTQKPKFCPSCNNDQQDDFKKIFTFETNNSEKVFRPYEKGEKLNEFIKEAKESLGEFKQEKMSSEKV